MKLLSIKSIYFSQELNTDIALQSRHTCLVKNSHRQISTQKVQYLGNMRLLYKNMRNIEDTKILYKIPTLNVNNLQRNVY